MEAALDQLRQFAATTDDAGRQKLRTRLRSLADSTEDAVTTIDRLGHRHLECAAVKVGCDLGLFRLLSEAQDRISVAELAKKIHIETEFIGRLMRYLAALGDVDEISKDTYSANKVTGNLANDLTLPGISHYFETCGPLHQTLPGWLKKNEYKQPADELHTVFQDAFNTPLSIRGWLTQTPANMSYLGQYVALRGPPSPSWLSVYPVEAQVAGCDTSRPVFVELGGQGGHQSADFRQKYPHVPGRVILQDCQPKLDLAPAVGGVDKVAHNLFESPPISGARFYFLQRAFHTLTLQNRRRFLMLLREAMAPDSVLLIDEAVLPETGADYVACAIDLTMLEAFGAVEHTESQWRETLADVGLELVKTHVYNPCIYESVLEVRLRQ